MSVSGDSILIRAIRQLGKRDLTSDSSETETDEEERCESLSDFSTDDVIESMAKFVNAIEAGQENGELPFPNVKPPPSMSARYNMSSKLSEHLQRLGYQGGEDLGYQTFMYGTEKELRNVFLFLMDKMPKEREPTNISQTDKKSILKTRIQTELSRQVSSQWNPPCVHPSGLIPNQDESFSRQGMGGCKEFCSCDLCFGGIWSSKSNFDLLPKETRAAFNNSRFKSPSQLCSSVINYNDTLKIDPHVNIQEQIFMATSIQQQQQLLQQRESENDVALVTSINSKTISDELAPLKFDLANESGIDPIASTINVEKASSESSQILAELQKKKEALEAEVSQLQECYKALRNESMLIRKQNAQEKSSIAEQQRELEKLVEDGKRRGQILSLLPEGEANLAKLQSIVSKNKEKLRNLHLQWDEHKNSLEVEHQQLQDKLLQSEQKGSLTLSAVSKLKAKIEAVEQDITHKETLCTKYSSEVAKLKKSVPRSVYTRQILDILSNISKQRQDTSKIIEDVKATQKDINLLEGKLYRTYIEADNKVFELAKSDPSMVHVYRGLTDLHKDSSAIVELVRQVGMAKRSTRAINDQIGSESSKKSGEKLSKLQQDLDKMKAENRLLKEKLKATRSK